MSGLSGNLLVLFSLESWDELFPSGSEINAWKRARVSPIFKEDLNNDPNNYWPISVLPVVSKLIERVVFNQLYEHLQNN